MPLTPQQQSELLLKTKQKVPNWQVSYWLMSDCGLSFQEACEERWKAIEIYEEENKTIQSEESQEDWSQAPSKSEESPWSPLGETIKESESDTKSRGKKARAREEFEKVLEENRTLVEAEELVKENACVTCGDSERLCGCEVKDVNEIPF